MPTSKTKPQSKPSRTSEEVSLKDDTKPEGYIFGRPTLYKPEYAQMLIEFMSRTSHEIAIDKTYYKASNDIEANEEGDILGPVKSTTHKVMANIFPTFERFAFNIGVTKQTLYNWANEVYPSDYEVVELRCKHKYPDFFDSYTRAREIQESILIENTIGGQYNSNFASFYAKNRMEYEDKITQKHEGGIELIDSKKLEKLDALLKDAVE